MEREHLKVIMEEAESAGLVPVTKVEEFIEFVATHRLVTLAAAKPYVGRVYGLQRHSGMYVHKMHLRSYKQRVDSNVLFPESCLILDECDTHLCVLGNDHARYWIKRFYFKGAVKEDGSIARKTRT